MLTYEQLDEIKTRASKATAGPWESDATQNEGDYGSGPDCVSGFSSYEVIAEKGRICDTINSDVAMVCEEYDEDGCTAFDEVGQANMDFIAHARTDIPALIAALEASEAARVKAEQERDAARGKHFKSTIHNGVSAQFLKHDAKRITALEQERDELRRQVTYWQAQTLERSGNISALERERDALKDALTNSCDLLESYIDTFGDMSGANREDLNDYRRALEAKP